MISGGVGGDFSFDGIGGGGGVGGGQLFPADRVTTHTRKIGSHGGGLDGKSVADPKGVQRARLDPSPPPVLTLKEPPLICT